MNVFNRIVTILLLIGLAALVVLLGVNPQGTLAAMQNALTAAQTFLTDLEASQRWVLILLRILIPLAVLVLLGWLLWREVRPRRVQVVRVRTEAGSQGTVSLDSVSRRLAWHIDQLADVITVQPKVTPHGKAVDVALDLETRPETDVPMKTDEVVAVTQDVLTEQMGLQVGKVTVHIRHGQYQDGS
jgi:hypothetical protein